MARPALIEKLMQAGKWLFKKELIPLDDLAGNALKSANGKLNVDFNEMPEGKLRELVLAMIKTGGGLAVDSQGRIYFDSSNMDTSIIEEVMKKLRLPRWLTRNINIYVNKSHAAAADSDDEGRGGSEKPFRSIQYAANFVCDNYNLSNFNVNLLISPETYDEYVSVGNCQTSGGKLIFRCLEEGKKFTIRNFMPNCNAVIDLHDAIIAYNNAPRPGSGGYQALTASSYVNLYDVEFHAGSGTSHNKRLMQAVTGGTIVLRSGVSCKGSCWAVFETTGGEIAIFSDMTVSDLSCSLCFAFANGAGEIYITDIGNGLPRVTGSATGSRYRITGAGSINVGGLGPDYFPGTTAGTIVEQKPYS